MRRGHLAAPVTWFASVERHIILGLIKAFYGSRRHSCGALSAPIGSFAILSAIQSVTPAHYLVSEFLELIFFPNLLAGHHCPETHYLVWWCTLASIFHRIGLKCASRQSCTLLCVSRHFWRLAIITALSYHTSRHFRLLGPWLRPV